VDDPASALSTEATLALDEPLPDAEPPENDEADPPGSCGRPRLDVCLTVPEKAEIFDCPTIANTWAGVFDGRDTAAFAEIGTAMAAAATTRVATVAGTHFFRFTDMNGSSLRVVAALRKSYSAFLTVGCTNGGTRGSTAFP
jgi:hypothetical protein